MKIWVAEKLKKDIEEWIIDKDMTLEEELIEYLRFILEIPDSQISNIIGTYNDYAKKAQME